MPLPPKPAMTPGSRHRAESAARPLGSARKKGTGGGTRRQGKRSGRASNRGAMRSLPFEHRPRGRADMIDRVRPRLPFQARSLPIRAFAPPGPAPRSVKADWNDRRIGLVDTGPLTASPPSGVDLLPTASGREPDAGLRFPFASPIWRAIPQADFMRLLIQGSAPVAGFSSLHMIRRGSTGQGQAIHGSA